MQHFATVPTMQHFATVPTMQHFATVPTMQHFATVLTMQHFATETTMQHYAFFSSLSLLVIRVSQTEIILFYYLCHIITWLVLPWSIGCEWTTHCCVHMVMTDCHDTSSIHHVLCGKTTCLYIRGKPQLECGVCHTCSVISTTFIISNYIC